MGFCFRFAFAVFAAAALDAGVGTAHAQEPTRAEADAMQTKLERVIAAAEMPRPADATPLSTTFTEREINAFLSLDGPSFLPPGIAMPRARISDDGRVQARAIVDLDAVARSRERSAFDPFSYLRGSVEVVAVGRITGSDGEGLIRYESATVGGVAVPRAVAQELLRFYTSTAERPRGFAFDEPFALPAGLRSVSIERSVATVTQ